MEDRGDSAALCAHPCLYRRVPGFDCFESLNYSIAHDGDIGSAETEENCDQAASVVTSADCAERSLKACFGTKISSTAATSAVTPHTIQTVR